MRTRPLIRLITVALTTGALTAGCGPQPQSITVSGDELAHVNGCGDAIMYGSDDDDSVAVVVRWSDAASRAVADGGFDAEVTLPHDGVEVELWRGEGVTAELCTDVIDPDRPPDPEEWDAVAGEASITVEPEPDADERMPHSTATVTLRDLEFELRDDPTVDPSRLDEVVLRDVLIGWVPG